MTEDNTKYFFVKGNESHKSNFRFNEFCNNLSEIYGESLSDSEISSKNSHSVYSGGVISIGEALIKPIPEYNSIIVKNYFEGLDKYLEDEFGRELL